MKFPWLSKNEFSILTPLEGYERWSQTYAQESNPIKDFSNSLVNQFLPELQGRSVLDVGCGTGYFCQEAKQKGAARIVGVDISESMLAKARQYCPSAEYVHSDILNLTFDVQSFDVIICALVLGHVQNIYPALEKLVSLLKSGGVLIISDFHPTLTQMNSKRTFQDEVSGKTFEIKHYLHPLPDTITWLKSVQLCIERLEEPLWKNVPVIYALKAKRG